MSAGGARHLLPTLGVAALLCVLALALAHGLRMGLGRASLETIGRVYFALLVGAALAKRLEALAREAGG